MQKYKKPSIITVTLSSFYYLCIYFYNVVTMINISHFFPITDPTLIFFVVILMILFSPIIMGKLRIPHIIGMVLAGVLVGKNGFDILGRDASFEIFGQVGLYYIMFLAGLELDMEGLRKNSMRVIIFCALTFLCPFVLIYGAFTLFLHFSGMAALLISTIMADNTLIAYPIVGRYGLTKHVSTTISVGGSMLALLISLIILSSITSSVTGSGDITFWLIFSIKFIAYSAFLFYTVPRVARWFLHRYSDSVMQFVFVLAIMFGSAALSHAIGVEGIFGAFLSGLILNRFIPKVSPLMNRLEFTGNALFIPYFLIGVGMLINVKLLFESTYILWIMLLLVVFGTLGKALASYIATWVFKLSLKSGHMMFGLTSAHAAGAIALAMVGCKLPIGGGKYLFDNAVLNGIVLMILFTCIISTMITQRAAEQLRLSEKEDLKDKKVDNDEKILVPVKYANTSIHLLNLATMMRNPKLKRDIVALNVVYDDVNIHTKQAEGIELLNNLNKYASAADVPISTQMRVAANIANGIMYAFKENQASEIVMGLHFHHQQHGGFWGEFARSVYHRLNRQIIIARIKQPLNTIRRIQVAVPSRAEYEPGFYRWLERLARMAENMECRIVFDARQETLDLIKEYVINNYPSVRAEYEQMEHWNELPIKAMNVKHDHMFVIITARKGTISYKAAMDDLPNEINKYFKGKTIMIIFPDQYGNNLDTMTFAEPQHTEERSVYEVASEWIHKKNL